MEIEKIKFKYRLVKQAESGTLIFNKHGKKLFLNKFVCKFGYLIQLFQCFTNI